MQEVAWKIGNLQGRIAKAMNCATHGEASKILLGETPRNITYRGLLENLGKVAPKEFLKEIMEIRREIKEKDMMGLVYWYADEVNEQTAEEMDLANEVLKSYFNYLVEK